MSKDVKHKQTIKPQARLWFMQFSKESSLLQLENKLIDLKCDGGFH